MNWLSLAFQLLGHTNIIHWAVSQAYGVTKGAEVMTKILPIINAADQEASAGGSVAQVVEAAGATVVAQTLQQ